MRSCRNAKVDPYSSEAKLGERLLNARHLILASASDLVRSLHHERVASKRLEGWYRRFYFPRILPAVRLFARSCLRSILMSSNWSKSAWDSLPHWSLRLHRVQIYTSHCREERLAMFLSSWLKLPLQKSIPGPKKGRLSLWALAGLHFQLWLDLWHALGRQARDQCYYLLSVIRASQGTKCGVLPWI